MGKKITLWEMINSKELINAIWTYEERHYRFDNTESSGKAFIPGLGGWSVFGICVEDNRVYRLDPEIKTLGEIEVEE